MGGRRLNQTDECRNPEVKKERDEEWLINQEKKTKKH